MPGRARATGQNGQQAGRALRTLTCRHTFRPMIASRRIRAVSAVTRRLPWTISLIRRAGTLSSLAGWYGSALASAFRLDNGWRRVAA